MSRVIRGYESASFSMIIRVITIAYRCNSIPSDALPALESAARKLCATHGFNFLSLNQSEAKVSFDIEIQPKTGDLGSLIGAIKSVWSRLLVREFGVISPVWLPRYLILTITPPDAEAIEQEWLEKVTKAFAEKVEPTEGPINDAD
ncbi:hypothetical protein HAP94_07045 [Acidithiobacillus ferrivorans]|nr:hypothetical protein [Acidithiobacillus ferrivorans]